MLFAATRLCASQSTDCCNSSLVGVIISGHEVPRTWFDNSIKYAHFRDKLASHITYMGNTGSSNETLWNATLAGLNVLSNWGVKYWDSHFIRNNVFTQECATKIAQAAACGLCVTGTDNTQLNEIMNDLNLWREPISWWTEENNACELLPETNCWNGEAVGSYEFPVVRWRQSFNPEFTDKRGSAVNPNVMLQLDKFHNELIQVRKSLEKYWPTSGSDTRSVLSPMSLSSEEFIDGSGGYDDEDLEYVASGDGSYTTGVHSKPIDSDDEDLPGYDGSGSGEAEDPPAHPLDELPDEPRQPTESRPPVRLDNSAGGIRLNGFS
ncbi:hypothetical protein Ocin01_01914, partial [Orchesella cincta]